MSPSGITSPILLFLFHYSLVIINASPLIYSHNPLAASAHPREYILSPHFDINEERITRTYTFNVTETTAALDGFLRPVLAINGQVPGPLIEANEGDQLEITVINHMKVGLTLHWHGLYQARVTQCPIPPDGGSYTYRFRTDGQLIYQHKTVSSHHQNLMADGINGPLIIHSPRDPLKRHTDFDQEVVLVLADWYHNTSTDIVEHMLSEPGYFGTPAAPGPNSALINGIGEWNCSQATKSEQCKQINSPPEFTFEAGGKIRFRLINAGVHAMFFYSVDEHTLNVTEADGTGIYGPPALHRVWLHNGQRYSVVINTREEDAGRSFYLRATMDSDCWAWVPNDIQLTAFGILRLVDGGYNAKKVSHSRPVTQDWSDEILGDCVDLPTSSMVPILKQSVPTSVVGSGSFKAGFGFQFINDTSEHVSRAEAVQLAQQVNSTSLLLTTNPRTEDLNETSDTSNYLRNDTGRTLLAERIHPARGLSKAQSQPEYPQTAYNKRQVKVGQHNLPSGNRTNQLGITRTGGPPPTPAGTIGKFFLNNISWTTYPYQPILHDLTPGGVGAVNDSNVANVIYPTAEWYDLYLANVDPAGSHPYHLHALDMHIVAEGKGLPTPQNLANATYNTDNPLRRDTIVVPPASFIVVRLQADVPGAWIVHCHIGWHIAAGFAGVVIVQPDVIKNFEIPQDNLDLCAARIEYKWLAWSYGSPPIECDFTAYSNLEEDMSSSTGGKPKKRAHIVRSGNAGNSSKSAAPTPPTEPGKDKPPPLFPPGSKTPVQLLHERCRHNKWEKPSVDIKRSSGGFTAVVTLVKKDKKDASLRHTVRMEPRPPLDRTTGEEAKHWAATYALFRFCNNMPLHRVLPPGPKDYWVNLEQEKRTAPAHRDWEFDPDPFQAAVEVKKRQQVREQNIEQSTSTHEGGSRGEEKKSLPKCWSLAPEVKMDHVLRDRSEQIIRGLLARIQVPDSESTSQDAHPSIHSNPQLSPSESKKLSDELIKMGFRPGHVSSALDHLSKIRNTSESATNDKTSQLARTLLKSFQGSSDRDALLQYLTVVVPEDDLPIRFRPTEKSTSFVTAMSSGAGRGPNGQELEIRWMVERLNRLHGFPLEAISTTLNGPVGPRESVALETLARRLAGSDVDSPMKHADIASQETPEIKELLQSRDQKRAMEKEALESIYGVDRYQIVPEKPETDFQISIVAQPQAREDLWLRISFHPDSLYPTATSLISTACIPTFSIISSTVPSYLRLALLKKTIEQFADPNNGWCSMLDVGEGGVIFEMVNYLEETWPLLAQEPPDVADVMYNFVVEKQSPQSASTSSSSPSIKPRGTPKQQSRVLALRQIPETDHRLMKEQCALIANPAYKSVLKDRQSLPAWSSRADFLKALSDPTTRVIVVAGETGSGKTTQLPQFILESECEAGRGSLVNIICTQPRRVSAIGVATRVASERLENIDEKDGVVGYVIRGEKRSGRHTKLLFATSGVLLRRLATSDPDLLGISHLFVDEVHERSMEGDLLLLELREILKRNLKIKIVLMSATANQDLFVNYFGTATRINIPGMTYPVKDFYLEDYLKRLEYTPVNSKSRPERDAKERKQAEELCKKFMAMGHKESESRFLASASKAVRYIDEHLIASIVLNILDGSTSEQGDGSLGVVLVFVSGVAEICSAIKAIENLCRKRVECLPLHSQLSSAEQKRVFRPTHPSRMKVVVATNIAETSITIPDVRYVIDSGREKQMELDPEVGMSRLVEVNCSQAAAKQRRGRAGRTISGVAYKLFTRICEQQTMLVDTKPEILRTPLEALFLQVKAIREKEDVPTYLQKALTPPLQSAVDRAIENLEVVGAFYDGSLTALGKHLAQLPLDVRLGKLLILGSIFKVFEPTLTLAAMLSVNKPLFVTPFEKREESSQARLKFKVANSDLLTNIKAFDEYVRIQRESGNGSAREFCETNYLSMSTIRDIISTRSDLLSQMQERGFVPRSYGKNNLNRLALVTPNAGDHADELNLNQNSEKLNLVKSVFAAGLSQVVRIEVPETKYDQIASGTIEKDVDSKAVKFFDAKIGRVFLHPSSVLFKSAQELKATFLAYFSRSASGSDTNAKVFLRDGTTVPLFGMLLLYGSGSIKLNHERRGLSIQTRSSEQDGRETNESSIKLRAPMRIGTLCNQLRHLLDTLLFMVVDQPEKIVNHWQNDTDAQQVIECVINLIESDGVACAI
ncbi:hypothetical protein PSTG_15294 [Puccinia striiformis f. sp. tritici PST-78]|uniref:Uncharacterized protein n=1 Tax=Puccinia striiformis f. sp. tritici PST-78 TaxID=1165861 RepID=A0A0L0UW67_9BASI|nr:hypothetical protein PSTG_15294 [Puccinia striiformis f. sp. tritici PST-78]